MKIHKNQSDTIDIMEEFKDETSKKPLTITQSTLAKVAAFILAVIMTIITVVCVIGALAMSAAQMYTTPKDFFLEDICSEIAISDFQKLTSYLSEDQNDKADKYCQDRNIAFVRIKDVDTNATVFEYKNNERLSDNGDMNFTYDFSNYGYLCIFEDEKNINVALEITIGINLEIEDTYTMAYKIVDFAYSMMYAVYVVGIISFVILAVCFVFLMCASGHRKGCDEVKAGWGTRVPFDLLTGVVIFLVTIISIWAVMICSELTYEIIVFSPVVFLIMFIALDSVLLGWCMSFATRIKLGKWWRNTIIYRFIIIIWKIIKFFGRKVKLIFKLTFKFLGKIPLVWKTALIFVGVSLTELFFMVCLGWDYGDLVILWFFSSIILGVAVLYCAMVLKKLQKSGKALAEGDLSYQVDTSKMFGDFKSHGNSLNSIAKGMTIAVEERMKSERMKTELITNVSHDIKTPLTSIINYTDLISKEHCDNEKINEYSEVLLRQSERLKRLIDDLVEASKASTGNLELHLAPCEANILLTQVVGEYAEKLHNKNLELVTTQPSSPIMIMADGRRLWRVFDNLINNICKYAQSSTRVYLSLEKQGNNAVITFKNTSHSPLNISANELMERFVRGDSSRNTEGNGLGLSIAKSLTELQKGILELSIDGDLFKVTLKFRVIE